MEATLLGRPHVFERGDRIYLTAPLVLATPTPQQVEEFAFASAITTKAPNENIGWLHGRYVEAGRANLNGAMWLSDELALKSLTPNLMPVTVMHDPRTAVGTIADTKLVQETSAARIDNILAIWKHRFPEVWEEAAHNIEIGQMMQSMECFTPWYSCSECATTFVKLPHGAERASWCDHLRTNSGWRILGDVCFTGTGLIFGSRGGVGAYTDAHLDHFQAEIAEYHERAHVDANYRPTVRSASSMALVQIEESELATLRRERDEAKRRSDELANENRTLTTKAEQAEAAQKRAEDEKAAADQKVKNLEDEKAKASLKDQRMNALGSGFMAKLGDTSKARLGELASTCSDEQWDAELKEREEWAGVKRDAQAQGAPAGGGGGGDNTPSNERTGFKSEEVASFLNSGVTSNNTGSGGSAPQDGATSVRQLARAFAPRKPANSGAKS
jgi:hypothetical protein